jgi:hypothetical protein
VNRETIYRPPTRLGIVVHAGAALLITAAGAVGLWGAAHANIGPVFLLYLLPAALAAGLGPLLLYQAGALNACAYILSRDGLRLRWGLRREDIPLTQVEWLRPAQEAVGKVPLPWLRLPGVLRGERKLAGVGPLEFMASDASRLLLIGTPGRVFAISPADPQAFMLSFQRATEMGSLTPLERASVYPSGLVGGVWEDRTARVTLLLGLGLSLLLLVWVSLSVPGRTEITLGFDPNGGPRILAPPVRLMLLPVLNGLFFLIDLLAGLFFYRRSEHRSLAYLLWGGAALTGFFFTAAVAFILQAS